MERKRGLERSKKEIEKYLVGLLVGGRRWRREESQEMRKEERQERGRKERKRAMKNLTHRYVISRWIVVLVIKWCMQMVLSLYTPLSPSILVCNSISSSKRWPIFWGPAIGHRFNDSNESDEEEKSGDNCYQNETLRLHSVALGGRHVSSLKIDLRLTWVYLADLSTIYQLWWQ